MDTRQFQLPAAEDELWQQVVVRLLAQRDSDEKQAQNHLRLLEELAFHQRFCRKPLTYTFAEATATWLAKDRDFGSPRDTAQTWLRDMERWELLVQRGSGQDATYEFAIPTLDEYFAARHLAARWAEDDKGYRTWLPLRRNWWLMGRKLHCPNPHCQTAMQPLQDVLRQSEYEEVILQIVGQLRDSEREKLFLKFIRGNLLFPLVNPFVQIAMFFIFGIPILTLFLTSAFLPSAIGGHYVLSVVVLFALFALSVFVSFGIGYMHIIWEDFISRNLNLKMQSLSRCRYAHATVVEFIANVTVKSPIELHIEAAWTAIRAARFQKNLDLVLWSLITALHAESKWYTQSKCRACKALGEIGDIRALKPLILALNDRHRWLRTSAARALRQMGDSRAVEPLRAALQDEFEQVRLAAAQALGEMGDVNAIPALRKLWTTSHYYSAYYREAIEKIEHRTGIKS